MPGLGRRCGLGFATFCAIMVSCAVLGFGIGKPLSGDDFSEYLFSQDSFASTAMGAFAGYLTAGGVPISQSIGGMFDAENDSDGEAVSPGDHSDSEGKDSGEADHDSVHADVESAAMPKGFGWVTVALIAGGFYLGFN
eukprot:916457_1